MSDLARVGLDVQELFREVYSHEEATGLCYGFGFREPRVPVLLKAPPCNEDGRYEAIGDILGIGDTEEASMLTEDERRLLAMKKLIDCYVDDAVEPKGAAFRCKLDGSLHSTVREAGEHVQATHGAQAEQLLRQLLDDMEQDHMGFFFTKMSFAEFLYPPVPPLVRQMASGYPSAPAPTFLPRTGARAQATAPVEKKAGSARATSAFPVRFGLKAAQGQPSAAASAPARKKGKKGATRVVAELQTATSVPLVSLARYKQLLALDGRLHPRQGREHITRLQEELEQAEKGKTAPSVTNKTAKQVLTTAQTNPGRSSQEPEAGKTQAARLAVADKGAGKDGNRPGEPTPPGRDGPSAREKEQKARGHGKKGSPKKETEGKSGPEKGTKGGTKGSRAGQKAERAAQAQREAEKAARAKKAAEEEEKRKRREEKKLEAAAAEKAAAESRAEGERLFQLYGEGLAEEMLEEVVENLLNKLAKRSLQQILKQRAKEAQIEAEKEHQRLQQEKKRMERKQRRDFRQQVAMEVTEELLEETVKAYCAKLAATALEDLHHEAWLQEEQRRQEAYRAAVVANAQAQERGPYSSASSYKSAHTPASAPAPAGSTGVYRPPVPEAVEMPLAASDYGYPTPAQDRTAFYDTNTPSPFMLPQAAGPPRAWAASPTTGLPPPPRAVAEVPTAAEQEMEIPDFLRDELQKLLGETAMGRGTGARPPTVNPSTRPPTKSEGSPYFSSPFQHNGSPEEKSSFLDSNSAFAEAPADDILAGVELLRCIPEDFGLDSLRCVAVRRLPVYITADHLCRFFGSVNVDVSLRDGVLVPKIQFLEGADTGTCLVQLKSQAAMRAALQRDGALLGQSPVEVQVPLGRSATDVQPAYSAFPVGASPLDIGLGPSVTGIGAAVSSLPLARPGSIRSPNLNASRRADASPRYKPVASPVLDGTQRFAVGSGSPGARRQGHPFPTGSRRGVPTDRFGASVFTGGPPRARAFPGGVSGAYAAYGNRKLRGVGPDRPRYACGAYYSPTAEPMPPPPPTSWAWPDDDELDDDETLGVTSSQDSGALGQGAQEAPSQQYHM